MGTVIDITQYELDHALENEEMESKIKLRRTSHANLIEHVKNIPYMAVSDPKIESAKFHLPDEQKNLNISPKKYMELEIGMHRPINVKEDKLENVRKHSDILVADATHQNLEQKVDVSIQSPVTEETMLTPEQENSQNFVNVNVASNNSGDRNNEIIDVNEYIARIGNETQLVKNVKEEAALAQQKAIASDENLNKLSVEVSELEKQEEAARKQDSELDQQLVAAYENQTRTLAIARKEYEDLIEEANTRRQENENKILQFQAKAEGIRDNITNVNESIARKQGILAALQQAEFMDTNNLIQFPTDVEQEDKVKRIA